MINEKTMKFIRIFLLILIIIGVGLLVTQKTWVPKVVYYILQKQGDQGVNFVDSKWTNTVTAVRTDCAFDGICSVTVGDIEVIVDNGGRMMPPEDMGKIKGTYANQPLDQFVGKKASVYARKINSKLFTLQGNTEFFIEINQ